MRTTLVLLSVLLLASGCVRRVVAAPPSGPPAELEPGKVELNVVSEDGIAWEVRSGTDAPCVTPCARIVGQAQELTLVSRNWVMEVPSLLSVDPSAKRAVIVAQGPSRALKVNGIVFTTLGGMGVVTGIALTAVGCSDVQRRGGLCAGGLITSAVTLPLMIVSIWMLAASGPTAHILPVASLSPADAPVQVAVTPAGLVGRF